VRTLLLTGTMLGVKLSMPERLVAVYVLASCGAFWDEAHNSQDRIGSNVQLPDVAALVEAS
jgi:hypothetical protein